MINPEHLAKLALTLDDPANQRNPQQDLVVAYHAPGNEQPTLYLFKNNRSATPCAWRYDGNPIPLESLEEYEWTYWDGNEECPARHARIEVVAFGPTDDDGYTTACGYVGMLPTLFVFCDEEADASDEVEPGWVFFEGADFTGREWCVNQMYDWCETAPELCTTHAQYVDLPNPTEDPLKILWLRRESDAVYQVSLSRDGSGSPVGTLTGEEVGELIIQGLAEVSREDSQ